MGQPNSLNLGVAVAAGIPILVACVIILILYRRYQQVRVASHQAIVEQRALLRSEELYRGIIDLAPVAIFIQSAGKCVFVNDAGLKLLGATNNEQVLGKRILDDYPYEPEPKDKRLTKGEQVISVEKQITRLDGTEIDVEMNITPYTYQSRPAIQIAAYDITERKLSRQRLEKDLAQHREQKEKMFSVYRDVIYAVTQGKFNLLRHSEALQVSNEGMMLRDLELCQPEDVSEGRQMVTEIIRSYNFPKIDTMHIALCVSETATNVIKHAGEGFMQIRKMPGKVRVIIKDVGPGMDFDKLPNMLFLEGFSTKMSLGYGFSIIFKFADKIFLDTSEKGTFLALDFYEEHYQGEQEVTSNLLGEIV